MISKYFLFIFAVARSIAGEDNGYERSWGGAPPGPRQYYCVLNPNPCINGGVCVDAKSNPDLGSSYECECQGTGCTGDHCEICNNPTPSGPCEPNPCKGDCRCQLSCKHSLGYYCRSDSGYLGKNCSIPPPTIKCESKKMVVSVAKRFVEEYDLGLSNSFLVVQPGLTSGNVDEQCKLRMSNVIGEAYKIDIPMPFNKCGTVSVQNADKSVSFKNQVWFNRDLKNNLFDVPIPAIAFECQYTREYQLVTSIQPSIPTPPTIKDSYEFVPTISLCKSEMCPSVCPSSLQVNPGSIYTVGEIIHVTMSLNTGTHVTTVSQMFISCSKDPTDSNVVQIVESGCGSLAGLPCKVTHNGESHTVCVSFQTPRSLSCSQIYIHATLSSCEVSALQTCTRTNPNVKRCVSDRKRRSIDRQKVIGPFYVISGSSGISWYQMYPENDLLLQTKNTSEIPAVVEEVVMKSVDGEEPEFGDEATSWDHKTSSVVVGTTQKNDSPLILIGFVAGAALLLVFVFIAFMIVRYQRLSVTVK